VKPAADGFTWRSWLIVLAVGPTYAIGARRAWPALPGQTE